MLLTTWKISSGQFRPQDASPWVFRTAPSRLSRSEASNQEHHPVRPHNSGILSGISSGILSGISSGILSGISSGILSGILSGISSGISSGILSARWGPAVPTELGRSEVEVQQCPLSSEGPRLGSSGAYWALKVPGWGPAVPTALGTWRLRSSRAHSDRKPAVEVQQCPLRTEVG